MVGVALLITIVSENAFEAADAELWDAHGAEGDVVVFDFGGAGDDAMGDHAVDDLRYVRDAFAIAAHEAGEDGVEGGHGGVLIVAGGMPG